MMEMQNIRNLQESGTAANDDLLVIGDVSRNQVMKIKAETLREPD